jgi:hypothetical protein
MSRRQVEGEDLVIFACQLKITLEQTGRNMDELAKVGILMGGLLEKYKKVLRIGVTSYEKAIELLEQKRRIEIETPVEKKKKKKNEESSQRKSLEERFESLEKNISEVRNQFVNALENRHWSCDQYQNKGDQGYRRANKRRKIICHHCKKAGHVEKGCWIKHPDLKPKSRSRDQINNENSQNNGVIAQEANKDIIPKYINLRTHVEIEDQPFEVLIDTGASVSVIRQDQYCKIKHKEIPHRISEEETIWAVSGEMLENLGMVFLKLQIGEHKSQH